MTGFYVQIEIARPFVPRIASERLQAHGAGDRKHGRGEGACPCLHAPAGPARGLIRPVL